VCDLGTQEVVYPGKEPKDVRQILIQWELPNCRINIQREEGDVNLPRVTGQKYTFSTFHGAKLAQHVTPWVGACPDDFDFETLLGLACYLSIVHEKGKTSDNVYANIASVMKVPAGTNVPVQENPTIFYDMATMGKNLPESLQGDNYKWIRDIIEQSAEFQGKDSTEECVENDDEVPF
jgi:hypothetical protein